MTESPIFADKKIGERRTFRTHRSLEQKPKELMTELAEHPTESGGEAEEVASDVLRVNESEFITIFEAAGNVTSQKPIASNITI